MARTAKFGSVSTATLKPEDLIPAFAAELRYLRGSLPRELHADIRKFNAGKMEDWETAGLVDWLIDELNARAPAYGYFGAHPGDGADFGFWLHESWLEDFDGLKVGDLSEVPAGYSGEVAHINERGNVELYAATRGKLRNVWGIV